MTSALAAAYMAISFLGFGSGSLNFDNQNPGTLPPYWTGTAAHWQLRRDDTAPSRPNVFARLPAGGDATEVSLAIYDKVICRDGEVSVKFKVAANDRRNNAVGIVWRYQDSRNYYLLRVGLDGRDIAVFHVQNGQTRLIPRTDGKQGVPGAAHDLRPNQWYVAKVVFRGDSVRVLFGNRVLFSVADRGLMSSGKTGLWTRGGTVASFDDFRIDKKT